MERDDVALAQQLVEGDESPVAPRSLEASTRHPNPCSRRMTALPMLPDPDDADRQVAQLLRPRTLRSRKSERFADRTVSLASRISMSINISV